jgi:predicted alpha/beta superfamily hydrolase
VSEDLQKNFTYHEPSGAKVELHQQARGFGKEFATFLDTVMLPSREKSLALTKIEEAVMWANAGIARN